MEAILAVVIGVLFGVGLYHLLSPKLIRVIVGTVLISHGSLLMLIAAGGLKRGDAPVLGEPGPLVDPLPQALILTAIVIGFATTALILVLGMRAYQASRTDDVDAWRGGSDEP